MTSNSEARMLYEEWIELHYPTWEIASGQCAEATLAMLTYFPELRRVRGYYYDMTWGERQHWWCVAPDGSIVDPTAKQFPSVGHGVYTPWSEGDEEPTGKCPNCGDLTYRNEVVCSQACGRAYVSYLARP